MKMFDNHSALRDNSAEKRQMLRKVDPENLPDDFTFSKYVSNGYQKE